MYAAETSRDACAVTYGRTFAWQPLHMRSPCMHDHGSSHSSIAR